MQIYKTSMFFIETQNCLLKEEQSPDGAIYAVSKEKLATALRAGISSGVLLGATTITPLT
jgi:hypothetical protein